MPELPEVETVRRGLERSIIGKLVVDVDVRSRKSFADDPGLIGQVFVGARVVAVERRAKVLLLELSTGWVLAIHLKMTGQLVVVKSGEQRTKSLKVENTFSSLPLTLNSHGFVGGHPEKVYEQPLPHKHTHVIVTFNDGTVMYFNDLRRFGWFRLFPMEGISDQRLAIGKPTLESFIASLNLGPEPLSEDFTVPYLESLVAKRSITIKQLLLEQKGISGIGNIYADESLFYAKVLPTRRASSLTKNEIAKLHEGIRLVLEQGIHFGGTSKNTYLNVEGTKGEMQDHLMVYGREGLPCRVCGNPIERKKIGQRSSHFCPSCQH